MSPIQESVDLAIQTYFQHYRTRKEATLLTNDPSLNAESSKDSMIKVLENVQSLVNEEITKRTAHLKRRRNQEHASIHKLPYEVFAEIILIAASVDLDTPNTFTLMSVSKYWCDTVAQCPKIWLRVDVTTRLPPGRMTVIRMLRGPVEIRCLRDPLDLEDSFADLATLDPTRLQALRCHWSPRADALHSFFRKRNSNMVNLAVEGDPNTMWPPRLELSPEGRCLRRVDLWRIALPWASPRLSQLQELTMEDLRHGQEPSVDDLYQILNSSPTLRRIRLRHFQNEGPAPTTIKGPLFLPVLRRLQFDQVPSIIPKILLPLLRAPSCRYLEINPRDWAPLRLEHSDTLLDLITSPITSGSMLVVRVSGTEGDLSVLLTTYPPVNRRAVLGYWDDQHTGISIRLFAWTVEGLRNMLDRLIPRLRAARWEPRDLHLASDMTQDTPGTREVLPLLCRLPLTFDTITGLGITSGLSSTHASALHLLEDGIPELTRLDIWHNPTVSYDAKECANGVKAFLARRYPLHNLGATNTRQQLANLSRIQVPREVAAFLRRGWPATSLSMEELLSNMKVI